ncbi:MAG TPA: MFS transporter [Steroidobacteraceae bacterium]|jgi:PAT family beta-lactamase induction signal transducer AmpG|nr:MFS transporter [Steroidobacteraceae bacterium]
MRISTQEQPAPAAVPAGLPAAIGSRAHGRSAWQRALLVYREPRVLSMLFLGFSSGLPFYLIFQTLSAWLRQDHIVRATIGMLAWSGLFFPLKFLWAPVVDRLPLPLLHRWLGRRRSWMLIAQLGIGACLLALSHSHPAISLSYVAIAAGSLAFCAVTQDISIDAWRIESAPPEEQGAMAAGYQLGYRSALIVGSAGALGLAQAIGWQASFTVMASLVVVGLVTTLLVREPHPSPARSSLFAEAHTVAWLERRTHWPPALQHAGATVVGAVVSPLADFLERQGVLSTILLLMLIGSCRLTTYAMGSMVNPFYIDHHYSLEQIATIVKGFGLPVSLVGVVIAGSLIVRIGVRRTLLLGSAVMLISNLSYALLATTHGPTLLGLTVANSIDNLGQALQGTAFIALLSALTSPRYTATQYALFSSFFALTGKLLEGTSGFVVDAIGYPPFFVYTASLSLLPLLLIWLLSRRRDLDPHAALLASA